MSNNYFELGISKGFKSKLFYKCEAFAEISDKNIAILTGPSKTGKTTCLKQLAEKHRNYVYIDCKDLEHSTVIDNLFDYSKTPDSVLMLDNVDKFMLEKDIEEFLHHPLNKIIVCLKEMYNFAEKEWHTIYSSFLDVEEWLVYSMKAKYTTAGQEVKYNFTNEEYHQYLQDVLKFHDVFNLCSYLEDIRLENTLLPDDFVSIGYELCISFLRRFFPTLANCGAFKSDKVWDISDKRDVLKTLVNKGVLSTITDSNTNEVLLVPTNMTYVMMAVRDVYGKDDMIDFFTAHWRDVVIVSAIIDSMMASHRHDIKWDGTAIRVDNIDDFSYIDFSFDDGLLLSGEEDNAVTVVTVDLEQVVSDEHRYIPYGKYFYLNSIERYTFLKKCDTSMIRL